MLFLTSKPALFFHRPFPVAIGTQDIASINLALNRANEIPTCNHFTDGFVFTIAMVKFQNNRITLGTLHARVS
jgi:hypothetical protein